MRKTSFEGRLSLNEQITLYSNKSNEYITLNNEVKQFIDKNVRITIEEIAPTKLTKYQRDYDPVLINVVKILVAATVLMALYNEFSALVNMLLP